MPGLAPGVTPPPPSYHRIMAECPPIPLKDIKDDAYYHAAIIVNASINPLDAIANAGGWPLESRGAEVTGAPGDLS